MSSWALLTSHPSPSFHIFVHNLTSSESALNKPHTHGSAKRHGIYSPLYVYSAQSFRGLGHYWLKYGRLEYLRPSNWRFLSFRAIMLLCSMRRSVVKLVDSNLYLLIQSNPWGYRKYAECQNWTCVMFSFYCQDVLPTFPSKLKSCLKREDWAYHSSMSLTEDSKALRID